MIDRLDAKVSNRIRGATWDGIRELAYEASRVLLSVSPDAASELTTIYVKFCPTPSKNNVYAVMWLKTSREIVIGLAIPDGREVANLIPAPMGMKYKGLTQYLTLHPGDVVPEALNEWARLAYSSTIR
jgi:hypothetical protein